MDETLFTVFNYLSAAIAQTFAALIALTAMFYVYRESKLREERKDYGRRVRAKFVSSIESLDDSAKRYMLAWLEQFSDWEFMMELLIALKDKTNPDRLKAAAKCLSDISEALIVQYYINTYRGKVWTPILLSAITTAVSLLFLCFARVFLGSPALLWVLMITETALALVTLGFIVAMIKKLIEEPNVKGFAEELRNKALEVYEREKAQKKKKDTTMKGTNL